MSEGAFQVDEDDWFGAGSSFDSGEELAAALLSLGPLREGREDVAGTAEAQYAAAEPAQAGAPQAGAPTRHPVEASGPGEFSTLVQPSQLGTGADRYGGTDTARAGGQRSGTGWRIREGVRSLRRAEDALEKLRADAVVVTWAAAGVAVRRARGDL